MRSASADRAADLHLVPCPHCGSPNGLNTLSCWNCEEALAALEAGGVEPSTDDAAAPETVAPSARPADGFDASVPPAEDGAHTSGAAAPDEDPRAAVDRAFAPLRQASEQAARHRRGWLAGGVLGAAVALAVLVYPILQAPVALQVDGAGGLASSLPAPVALRRDDAPVAAPVTMHVTALPGPPFRDLDATHSTSAAPGLPMAAQDPAAALGLAGHGAAQRSGDKPAAGGSSAPATRGTVHAKARRATPACAVAAAVLGLCQRNPVPE